MLLHALQESCLTSSLCVNSEQQVWAHAAYSVAALYPLAYLQLWKFFEANTSEMTLVVLFILPVLLELD